MANLENSLNPVIKLENLSHNADDNFEKIGEIYRISPEHLSFLCSQCGEQFPILIQFTAHVQKHLHDIFEDFKQPLASPSEDKTDVDNSFIVHVSCDVGINQSEDIIIEPVVVKAVSCNQRYSPMQEKSISDYKPTTVKDRSRKISLKTQKYWISRKFECYLCRKPFVNKGLCYQHIATEHMEHKYRCIFCDKKFVQVRGLTIHFNTCNQSNAYNCADCHLSFHSASRMYMHRHNAHNADGHWCGSCEITFPDEQTKAQHLLTHSKPFQCDECGQQFKLLNQLNSHKAIHSEERPYKCDQCPKAFKHMSTWYIHRKIHYGIRKHECELCGKKFFEKGKLNYHQRTNHGILKKESQAVCPICEKTLSTAKSLRIHMRRHTGQNLLDCPQCDYKCAYRNDMDNHRKAHSDQRDFPCDLCSRAFKLKKALVAHRRIHLNDYKFKCKWCTKGFHDRRIYERHTLKEHGRAWNEAEEETTNQ